MNKSLVIAITCLLLAGCGEAPKPPQQDGAVRHYEKHILARGERIFQTHCAVCHGASAEGKPNWQVRGPDGMLPPPPLDDKGRAWLRSRTALKQMVRDGSPPGQGMMPAWGKKLSSEEIDDVVTWITSLWSDATYLDWYNKVEKPSHP